MKFPIHKLKDLLKLINVIEKVSEKHTQKIPEKEPNTSKITSKLKTRYITLFAIYSEILNTNSQCVLNECIEHKNMFLKKYKYFSFFQILSQIMGNIRAYS